MPTENLQNFEGQWHLIARAEISADLMPDGSDGCIQTEAWLAGVGPDPRDSVVPTFGLHLIIESDGEVTEEADERAKFEWYDFDGVLEGQAIPHSGQLVEMEGRIVLTTDNSRGAYRYADGDTTISESFKLEATPERRLVRTVSIETDGIYGSRQVYVYSPTPE